MGGTFKDEMTAYPGLPALMSPDYPSTFCSGGSTVSRAFSRTRVVAATLRTCAISRSSASDRDTHWRGYCLFWDQ